MEEMQKDCREQSLPCASRHLHIPVQWPLLQFAASIKQYLVGAGLPANSAFGLTLWKVRGQGRSYAPRLRLEFLVGATLPANSAFGLTLWNVRGQGRSRTSCASRHLHFLVQWPLLRSAASIRSCRSGLAREFGVWFYALECSRPRPLLQIRGVANIFVGASLLTNPALGLALWNVRGQGRAPDS